MDVAKSSAKMFYHPLCKKMALCQISLLHHLLRPQSRCHIVERRSLVGWQQRKPVNSRQRNQQQSLCPQDGLSSLYPMQQTCARIP